MKKLVLLIFIMSNVSANETISVANQTIEMTVGEIVEHICVKLPFTNDEKCIKKKMECIDIDYKYGSELKEAIFDCF